MGDALAVMSGLSVLFGIFFTILWILIPFLIWGVSQRLNKANARLNETIKGLNNIVKENREHNEKLLKAVGRLPRAKYHQPEDNGGDDGFVSGSRPQHTAR